MLQRWQNIEAQQDNPALYNVLVQEYKSEDRLIGLAAQLRRAWRQNNADLQQEIKQQIRFQAGQLVDLNLQQRALRIEQVRKLLTQEQADLDADARNRDQLADDRANQVMEQVGGDFRPLPNSNQPASSQPSPGNP
jgi:hypothetical protein